LGLRIMVCCLLCFDDGPIEGDPRAGYGQQWKIGMMEAPCKDPGTFCFSFFCCPCAQYSLREKALGGDWSRYKCCQGYYDCACFTAGKYGDEGNQACMICEECCCLSCAVSSSRMLVMDSRNIIPDPCDNRIIRFNNCIQMLSCICHIAACIVPELRDIADLIDFIADIVFYTTQACMTTQACYEIKNGTPEAQMNYNYQPAARAWNKEGADAQAPSAPQGQQMQGRPQQGYPQQGYPQQGMQPVQPPMQMAVAQARMFQVVCPQGVQPGQQIIVTTPDHVQMGVLVPQGVAGGQVFQVNY